MTGNAGVESAPKIAVEHVQAVHDAAHAFEEGAAKRKERMPTSAETMRETAARLREVESFLLQFSCVVAQFDLSRLVSVLASF